MSATRPASPSDADPGAPGLVRSSDDAVVDVLQRARAAGEAAR